MLIVRSTAEANSSQAAQVHFNVNISPWPSPVMGSRAVCPRHPRCIHSEDLMFVICTVCSSDSFGRSIKEQWIVKFLKMNAM